MNTFIKLTENSNMEILRVGFREYLTPKTKEPIYDVGIIAKVKVSGVGRYGRKDGMAELVVSFWSTVGPNTRAMRFNQVLIHGSNMTSRMNKFRKKFPNEDMSAMLNATGVELSEDFNAHNSYLLITDWYTEEAKKGYY